jgi:glucose-1-phosphate thymidylyltransferase
MKAIIPVAGAGTRLRPHTNTQPKCLLPVAGKPIISYIIEELQEAGVKEFILIIGYLGEKIKQYIEINYPKLNIQFIIQEERKGIAHALWVAKEGFKNEESIVVVLGDTIFDHDIKKILKNKTSFLGVKSVSDPRDFGVVELDATNTVIKVVEKPLIPKSNLALVGLYKINEVETFIEGLDYVIKKDIKTRNEYQLSDVLMYMIDQKVKFSIEPINNWFDCGKKDILLITNSTLLEKRGYLDIDVEYDNTIIVHPVSIGEGCEITNSIIGPNVTIGENTKIQNSIIKDAIIGSYTSLNDIALFHSIIGNDTSIKGACQSLNIGDDTEIDLS